MTSLTHGSALRGRSSGGIAARRRLIRWAWGLFRREWHQQILVVALLTVAVAAAVSSVTVAYNSGPLDYAEFGSASALLELDGADPSELEAVLVAAEKRFGTTDVIGHRSLPVPGGIETMELRAQDPGGPYSRLALREGSYPNGPNQVAVTDGVAALLGLDVGKTLALDGHRREVVGIVENPRELSDEFALVSPSSAGATDTATVLVDAGTEQVRAFVEAQNGSVVVVESRIRGHYEPAPELAMFSVATVFMLLAALVATAGFAVIARKRLRQLGMLAAIGATEKHLRLVLVSNGAIVGVIAGLIGTVAGLALWFTLAPTLEPSLDYRLDRSRLPWALFAMTTIVAVVAATAAAWWPARAVARIPITLALSARPPRPKPAHHSAIVAVVLIAAGAAGLVLSGRSTALLVVAGILATILGTLLLCPLAIRLFARAAGHAPIAVRLALRDLARYQARSGAALAAITLALGIAAAVVIVAAAEEKKAAGDPPNLSNRQIRAYTGPIQNPDAVPIQTPAELDRMAARVRQLAVDLGGATVTPLRSALQPGLKSRGFEGVRVRFPIGLRRQVGAQSFRPGASLYVATPALLRHLGIDPAAIDPSTDFLADASVPTDELVIPDLEPTVDDRVEVVRITNVQSIGSQEYLGGHTDDVAPASFITLEGLRRHGWTEIPSGWLVESGRPLTSEQIAGARAFAAAGGLTIEVQRETTSFATVNSIATAAGALLALAILAMTVGLIRSESAGDLRTLTATGATSRIRRTLAAATAGGLALLGALLGVAGAYLMLAAAYFDNLDHLGRIPVLHLALMVIGIPLAAATAGWLLAGREPPAIARPVFE